MTKQDFDYCKEWFAKNDNLKAVLQFNDSDPGFVLRLLSWPRDEQPNHDNMEYVRIEIPETAE
jgi:hypothetical protein